MTIGEIDLTQNVLELRDRTKALETTYQHVADSIDLINEHLAESRLDRKELVGKVDGIQTQVTRIQTQLSTSQRMRARDWAAVGVMATIVSGLVAAAAFVFSHT